MKISSKDFVLGIIFSLFMIVASFFTLLAGIVITFALFVTLLILLAFGIYFSYKEGEP